MRERAEVRGNLLAAACADLTQTRLQNCGGTQGSARHNALPPSQHLYSCKLMWNCLCQFFVDPPFCLVTDVNKPRKEMVSLLPGSCSENLGHLLNGLLRFWSHGAAALAGALLLCNSRVWKALPFNAKNGKDRCSLGLVLIPLISQELSCCCRLSSLRLSTRAPLFTCSSRRRVTLPRSELPASGLLLRISGGHKPTLRDVCEAERVDRPHCFTMHRAGITLHKLFAGCDYRLE